MSSSAATPVPSAVSPKNGKLPPPATTLQKSAAAKPTAPCPKTGVVAVKAPEPKETTEPKAPPRPKLQLSSDDDYKHRHAVMLRPCFVFAAQNKFMAPYVKDKGLVERVGTTKSLAVAKDNVEFTYQPGTVNMTPDQMKDMTYDDVFDCYWPKKHKDTAYRGFTSSLSHDC
jgi:hypothetical protein